MKLSFRFLFFKWDWFLMWLHRNYISLFLPMVSDGGNFWWMDGIFNVSWWVVPISVVMQFEKISFRLKLWNQIQIWAMEETGARYFSRSLVCANPRVFWIIIRRNVRWICRVTSTHAACNFSRVISVKKHKAVEQKILN